MRYIYRVLACDFCGQHLTNDSFTLDDARSYSLAVIQIHHGTVEKIQEVLVNLKGKVVRIKDVQNPNLIAA